MAWRDALRVDKQIKRRAFFEKLGLVVLFLVMLFL